MIAVMTVDQRSSRRGPDRVEAVLTDLNSPARAGGRLRDFERTAGDEVQGVLDDAAAVVDTALRLARAGVWSTGIGLGTVDRPLPASTRAGSGEAFQHAREAVERAKHADGSLAVSGPDEDAAARAQAVLALLAAVVARRSDAGWEAVDLMAPGVTQADVADRLGISRQAVSQRLQAALHGHEQAVRPAAAALLEAAAATGGHAPTAPAPV